MSGFLDLVFDLKQYDERGQRDQARLIYGFTIILMVLFILYSFLVVQRDPQSTLMQRAAKDVGALLPILSVLAIGCVTLVLTRLGRADFGAFGPVLMWYLSGVLLGLQGQFVLSDSGAALMLLVILATVFLRMRGLLIGTVAALATLGYALVNYRVGQVGIGAYRNSVIGVIFELIATAAVNYLFLRSTSLVQSNAAEERLRLANVTTQIAQRISRRATVGDLLSNAVNDIRDSYSTIYHVQIFLVNPQGTEAELAASTGEVGKTLLERKHSLTVGSQSVIGQVTYMGQNIIARAGSGEGIHRRNEFLPDTVAEAAFPLRIGEAVIGALDLQSRSMTAFTESELPIFQSLADSIAVAIDNARLFGQTEQRIQENQRVVEQMRSAVREVERLNRQLTEQAWTEYLDNKDKQLGVDVDFSNNVVRTTVPWTATLDEAMQGNQLVQKPTRNGVIVSVPLRVRGAVIGAMEFELPGEVLTPEDINLVQAVAERFGLAVESTRLYEESRRVAQRETTLNEIGGRLQRTNSIDSVLAEAARGLQSSLGASRVAIRLGAPPKAEGSAV